MHPDYDGSSIGAGFDLGLLIFEKDLFDKRTGQPFAPLPKTQDDPDILHVTRTWQFMPGGELIDQ